jgi:hypothetical protein
MGRRLYFPNHDLALVVAHSDHPARRTRRHGLREQAVVPDSPDRHALDDAKMAFGRVDTPKPVAALSRASSSAASRSSAALGE